LRQVLVSLWLLLFLLGESSLCRVLVGFLWKPCPKNGQSFRIGGRLKRVVGPLWLRLVLLGESSLGRGLVGGLWKPCPKNGQSFRVGGELRQIFLWFVFSWRVLKGDGVLGLVLVGVLDVVLVGVLG